MGDQPEHAEQEQAQQLPDCGACGNTGRRPHERSSGPPIMVNCSCGRAKNVTGRHAAPGASTVEWWVSHYDQWVHAYRARGEIYSEAVCTHTTMSSKLTDDDGTAVRCMACVLIVGDELTEHHAERDRWQQ
jgi:hypothetical protein